MNTKQNKKKEEFNNVQINDEIKVARVFNSYINDNQQNKVEFIIIQNQTYMVFISGNNLVFLCEDWIKQLIIQGTNEAELIISFAFDSNQRYVAISEQCFPYGIINVYDLNNQNWNQPKKKRLLTTSESQSTTFNDLLFLQNDEKFILSYSQEKIKQIQVWNWIEQTLVQIVEVQSIISINNFFIFSDSDTIVYLYGKCDINQFPIKTYKLNFQKNTYTLEAQLDIIKDFVKDYSQNIVQHLVYDNKIAIFGTDQGEILIQNKQKEIKQILRIQDWQGQKLSFIIPVQNGFICSYGWLKFKYFKYIGKDAKNLFVFQNDLLIESSMQIWLMKLYNKQLIFSNIQGILYYTDIDNLLLRKQQTIQDLKFYLSDNHSSQILGCQVNQQKKIIVTTSMDCDLIIWRLDNGSLLFKQLFGQPILKVFMHPDGIHVFLCFNNKISFAQIFFENVWIYKDFPINQLQHIKLSNNGNLLSVIDRNGIQIIDIENEEKISDFIDFVPDIELKEFYWGKNDLEFFMLTKQGRVMVANLHAKLIKNLDMFQQDEILQFQSLIYDKHIQKYIYTTNQKKIILYEKSIASKDNENSYMTKEVSNKQQKEKILQAETQGYINWFYIIKNQSYIMFLMSQELNSKNDRKIYLMSLSELKTIFVLNVFNTEIQGIEITSDEQNFLVYSYDNSMIIMNSSYQDKLSNDFNLCERFLLEPYQFYSLVEKIEEVETYIKQQERRQIYIYLQTIKQKNLQIKQIKEIQLQQQQKNQQDYQEIYELCKKEYNEQYQKIYDNQETIKNRLYELENSYQQRINQNNYKIDQHNLKIQEKKKELETQNQAILKEQNIVWDQIQQQYSIQIQKLQQENKNLHDQLQILKDQQIKQLQDLHLDQDDNLMRLKRIIDLNKQNLESDYNNYEQKVEQLWIQFEQEEQLLKEQEQLISEIENQINDKQTTYQNLIKEMNKTTLEIENKVSELNVKSDRIQEINNKNTNLEKLRLILNQKISELKQNRIPWEEEILKMQTKLQSMKNELEIFFRNNKAVNFNLKEILNKINNSKEQIKFIKQDNQNSQDYLSQIKEKMINSINFQQTNTKQIKETFISIYQQFVQDWDDQKNQINVNLIKNSFQQKNYYEKCNQDIKQKLQKLQEVHQGNYKKIIWENVDLINTLNDLKKVQHQKQDYLQKLQQTKEQIQDEIQLALQIKKAKD